MPSFPSKPRKACVRVPRPSLRLIIVLSLVLILALHEWLYTGRLAIPAGFPAVRGVGEDAADAPADHPTADSPHLAGDEGALPHAGTRPQGDEEGEIGERATEDEGRGTDVVERRDEVRDPGDDVAAPLGGSRQEEENVKNQDRVDEGNAPLGDARQEEENVKSEDRVDKGNAGAGGDNEVDDDDEEEEGDCLSMILYDKPMKTGSTAVMSALEELLRKHNEKSLVCKMNPCGEYAGKVCKGSESKIHLIDHIALDVPTTQCLKDMGYYSVTSIRDPAERWESAYKFNRWKKGDDYGISHLASYDDFMQQMPNCALLRYYDLGPSECHGSTDDPEFQKRVQDILVRFDEIIDLYGEAVTELHKKLMPFMSQQNVSDKKSAMGNVPRERLAYEQVLYDALVKKRFELAQNPNPKRRLCKVPRIPS